MKLSRRSGSQKLLKQQEHDRRKKQYAKNHGIKLLEIWYWDFDNIENKLKKHFDIGGEKI